MVTMHTVFQVRNLCDLISLKKPIFVYKLEYDKFDGKQANNCFQQNYWTKI